MHKIIINKSLLKSNSLYIYSQSLWDNHNNVRFEVDIDFNDFILYLPNLLKYPLSDFSEVIKNICIYY